MMDSPVEVVVQQALEGVVVKAARQKTITVAIQTKQRHPLYGKIVLKVSKFHAHDEYNEYKVGDLVEIFETRPISKTKSWMAKSRVKALEKVNL